MNGRGGCCWAPQPRTHHGFGGQCRSEGAITTAAASADVRRSAGSLRGYGGRASASQTITLAPWAGCRCSKNSWASGWPPTDGGAANEQAMKLRRDLPGGGAKRLDDVVKL